MRWTKLSRKQKRIFTWWTTDEYSAIICDGAIRTGKTLCMSTSFVMWAMTMFDGQQFAFCGKTIESLRRNVTNSLASKLEGLYTVTERRSENLIEIRCGTRCNRFYLFGGKDERAQDLIQGITLAGVLFDEVALMPESFVNQATARCSVKGRRFWFNCNPSHPEHWFHKEWIQQREKHRALHLHFTMADNLSLDADIRRDYESQYSGVFYRRYILGEWVGAGGLVYEDFGENNITDEVPAGGEYYISVDYGTLNPFSAGLWCVTGTFAVRVREFYYNGRENAQKTDEDYCSDIAALAGDKEIKHIIVDPSAASFAVALRRKGYKVAGANNEVLDGIRRTAVYLRDGNIRIHRSCVDSIREFGLYRWDDKATEDRVVKENDHAMDDIRYFCNTVLRPRMRKKKRDTSGLWLV